MIEFSCDENVWYVVLVARIVASFSAGGREEEDGTAGLGGKRCCGREVGRWGEEKSVGCCTSSVVSYG